MELEFKVIEVIHKFDPLANNDPTALWVIVNLENTYNGNGWDPQNISLPHFYAREVSISGPPEYMAKYKLGSVVKLALSNE